MKIKSIIVLIFCVLLSGIISCEKTIEDNIPNDIYLNQKAEKLVKADNEFGFKLLKQLKSEPGKNLCISPLSISMALGMTYNGARNETRTAMEETLGLAGLSTDDINRSYRDLINALVTNDPKVLFEIANSIWSRQDFPVEQDFKDINEEYFDAEVSELDFNDPGAVDMINKWVSDKTHEKIETILEYIPADAVMYLINAIYFKGIWQYEFDEENTYDNIFTLENNEQIMVPVMNQKGTFNYLSNDLFSSVELAYGSGNFSMHILLPKQGKSVDDIIDIINEEEWNQWLTQYEETEDVTINLPKFKFAFEKSLNDVLKELGMEIAFTSNADFTGINTNGNLFISDVKHKTFIEVNEEGTEAAAVTSVEISLTSIGGAYFMVNKPFMFIIKEKNTNVVLFAGKVLNPLLEE